MLKNFLGNPLNIYIFKKYVIHIRNLNKFPLLFSERYGYKKYCKIFNICITIHHQLNLERKKLDQREVNHRLINWKL